MLVYLIVFIWLVKMLWVGFLDFGYTLGTLFVFVGLRICLDTLDLCWFWLCSWLFRFAQLVSLFCCWFGIKLSGCVMLLIDIWC